MTYRSQEQFQSTHQDRAAIVRRAEQLRAEEAHRLFSALFRRVRRALADFTGRGRPVERVDIPRAPSSAIF